jgi:transposase
MAQDTSDLDDDDDEAWATASQRADVIRQLLGGDIGRLKGEAVAAAASELGISRAGVYRLVARYKAIGRTSSLLPQRRGRPKGSRSLDRKREAIIAEEIDAFYLRPERPRLSDLCDRINARCHEIRARALSVRLESRGIPIESRMGESPSIVPSDRFAFWGANAEAVFAGLA